MNAKHKAMLESYGRSFLVAAIAALSSGAIEWNVIFIAGAAGVVGPVLRAMNKNDAAFGLVADRIDVEVKAIVKKSAAKKKTK